jgi:hypothetical protein
MDARVNVSDEAPIDVGDNAQVRDRGRDHRLALREEADAFRAFMASPAGRRWMHRVLTRCHIHDASSPRASAMEMAYSEGERGIGLLLEAQIFEHCAPRYIEMMQENNRERPSPAKPVDNGARRRAIADSPFGHVDTDYSS